MPDLDEHHDHEHGGHDHDGHDHGAECQEALAQLYTFLDGELTTERRVVISHHLDDCNPCLEVFDFEAELRIVVAAKCAEKVPQELRERIARQLEAIERGESGAPGLGRGSACP